MDDSNPRQAENQGRHSFIVNAYRGTDDCMVHGVVNTVRAITPEQASRNSTGAAEGFACLRQARRSGVGTHLHGPRSQMGGPVPNAKGIQCALDSVRLRS